MIDWLVYAGMLQLESCRLYPMHVTVACAGMVLLFTLLHAHTQGSTR